MQPPLARIAPVVLSFGAVLTLLGCSPTERKSPDSDKPRACTEMGCFDAAVITTKLSAAGAPVGTHSFALDVDGTAQTCTVEFVSQTETAQGQCTGNASLMFGPEMKGTESSADGAVSISFEPIPGKFQWQLTLEGQPKQVHVVHTQGGNTILDQKASFTYTDNRPNGPGCEPVCKAASVEWTGP